MIRSAGVYMGLEASAVLRKGGNNQVCMRVVRTKSGRRGKGGGGLVVHEMFLSSNLTTAEWHPNSGIFCLSQ